MTDAEKAKKFLNYAGLEHFIELLKTHGFADKLGLSQENFTTELKTKYDALVSASSAEELTGLFNRVSELENLIEADSDQAINKFNEIVAFLSNIESSDTLEGIVNGINTSVSDAKKAGTDAAAALDAYKTEANGKFVVKESGKGLSSNDYTTEDKAAVATIADKLNASDMAAITSAEIDALVKA